MKYTLVGKKTGLRIPVTNPDAVKSNPLGWWASMEEDPGDRWFNANAWDLVTDQTNIELFDSLEPGDKFTSAANSYGYYIKLDANHLYWVNTKDGDQHNNIKTRDEFFYNEDDEYEAKIAKMEG